MKQGAPSKAFSVLQDLFEIIIRPEVFYKCMGKDELVFLRVLNIYLLILAIKYFVIIPSRMKRILRR